jgi:hypothetical protein
MERTETQAIHARARCRPPHAVAAPRPPPRCRNAAARARCRWRRPATAHTAPLAGASFSPAVHTHISFLPPVDAGGQWASLWVLDPQLAQVRPTRVGADGELSCGNTGGGGQHRCWRPPTQAKMHVPTDSFGGMDGEHFVANILKKLSIRASVEVIRKLVRPRSPGRSSSWLRRVCRLRCLTRGEGWFGAASGGGGGDGGYGGAEACRLR